MGLQGKIMKLTMGLFTPKRKLQIIHRNLVYLFTLPCLHGPTLNVIINNLKTPHLFLKIEVYEFGINLDRLREALLRGIKSASILKSKGLFNTCNAPERRTQNINKKSRIIVEFYISLPYIKCPLGDITLLDESKDVGAGNLRQLAALYCGATSGFEIYRNFVIDDGVRGFIELVDHISGRFPFVLIGTKSLFPHRKGTCCKQGQLFARKVRFSLLDHA
ncbi:hypothetical protein LguiB_006218 [Lonicera macranthoides]